MVLSLKRFFIIGIYFAFFNAFGQNKFPNEPDKFIAELKFQFLGSKNEAVIKTGNDFETVWSGLSQKQQNKVISLFQNFQKKKFKINPIFSGLISCLNGAVKVQTMQGNAIDSLLIVTELVCEKHDLKQFQNYLTTLKGFLETKNLYKSNYSAIRMTNGNFSICYSASSSPSNQENLQPIKTEEPINMDTQENGADWFQSWDNGKEADKWTDATTDNNVQISANEMLAQNTEVPQPEITGPYIKFNNTDLFVISKYDSSYIKNTSGSLMLFNRVFVGVGGTIDWSIAGISSAIVTLKKYNFDVSKLLIDAENVTLNYPEKLDHPIQGVFEYNSTRHKDATDSKYPRFMSYSSNIKVKNIGEGISYLGGFSLNGAHIFSSSLEGGKSQIEVSVNGEKKFKAIAPKFELMDKEILANVASIIIYQNQDSVLHAGVRVDYEKDKQTLKLFNDIPGFKDSPFMDTYHKMEIVAEFVKWPLTSNIEFNILSGKADKAAEFRSVEYFDENEFKRMQGVYSFHPLIMITSYYREFTKNNNGSKEFSVDAMSKANKLNPQTVKSAMNDLAKHGFVKYNEQKGTISITKKTWHYFLSKNSKKDYDNLFIPSLESKKANGILDISSNELAINGVKRFYLSENLGVYLEPTNNQIKILKNRNFLFDGRLHVGKHFLFEGRNLRFDYDSFLVDMKNIDSLRFFIYNGEKDEKGKPKLVRLNSKMENSAGIMYINQPDNKSAKKFFYQYPRFKSYKGSFIYYDTKEVLDGVYAKDVHFEIPPFTLDSMVAGDHNGIKFDGTFRSNGIFPDMPETVRPMQDLSLGFEHKCKPEGLPLYKGKGKFYKTFSISNAGLHGNGDLDYLTGKYKSEDFVFFPDSVLAGGYASEIKEGNLNGTFFPDATSSLFDLRWLVKQDTMFVSNNEKPFKMYSNTVDFIGKAVITPKGLRGQGEILTRGSEAMSLNIQFKQQEFLANEAIFKILTEIKNKPALLANNVRLNFNFKNGHALFTPEIEGQAANEFPFLQYKTSMSGGDWDLAKKAIKFEKENHTDISKSYFYSIKPDQDSLSFNAVEAFYDLKTQKLDIEGVPEILVADCKITPDSNKVFISENAVMEVLKKSRVLIDTIKQTYSLHSGEILVLGRNKFSGTAIYDYYNADSVKFPLTFSSFTFESKDSKQKDVSLDVIEKDSSEMTKKDFKEIKKEARKEARLHRHKEDFRTWAQAHIKDTDTFRLAPKIIYKGKCLIYADRPALAFDGEVNLDLRAYAGSTQWIKYNRDGKEDVIDLNIVGAKTTDGVALTTGLHIDILENKLYSTYVSKKRHDNDQDVFLASDNLSFDNKESEFRVGDPLRVSNKKLTGNVFTYNDKLGSVKYFGKINLLEPNKAFVLESSVIGGGKLDSAAFGFNTFIKIKYELPVPAMDAMAKMLTNIGMAFNVQKNDGENRDSTAAKLGDLTNEKTAQSFKSSSMLDRKPLFSYDKELAKCFVMSDVNLKWSPSTSSFYSEGMIGIANILKNDINMKINGHLEIKKTPNGDIISFYYEPSPGNWWFFYNEQNKLAVLSSDPMFNTAISSKSKGEQAKGKYYFVLADDLERQLFLKDFGKNYLGKEIVDEVPSNNEPEKPKEETPAKKEEGGF